MQFAALARPGLFAAAARHRDYRLYVIGNIISLPGNWLQSAAQAWLVLELTHSAAAVGSVTFWTFLPYAALGIAAGPVVDMLNPRQVLLATQAALAAAAVLLALLSMSRHADMLDMDLIASLRGCALVLNNPARQVLLVRIVGRQDLKSALSLNSAVNNVGRVGGPALAGVLIARVGISTCFWLNAASFVPLIAAIASARPSPRPGARRPGVSRAARDLLAGLRYAVHHRTMRLAAGLLAVAAIFTVNFSVLLPVYTAQVLRAGPSVYGLLYSLLGLGSLLGAVAASASKTARWGNLLVAAAAFGGGEIILGLAPLTGVAVAAVLLTGAGYSAYTTTTNTMMQLNAPDEMQGRVGALYSYIFTGSNPVTSLLMGDLAQLSSAAVAFSVGGSALCAAAAACSLLRPGEPQTGRTPPARESADLANRLPAAASTIASVGTAPSPSGARPARARSSRGNHVPRLIDRYLYPGYGALGPGARFPACLANSDCVTEPVAIRERPAYPQTRARSADDGDNSWRAQSVLDTRNVCHHPILVRQNMIEAYSLIWRRQGPFGAQICAENCLGD